MAGALKIQRLRDKNTFERRLEIFTTILQVKIKVIILPNLFCFIKSLISFGHFNFELDRNVSNFGVKEARLQNTPQLKLFGAATENGYAVGASTRYSKGLGTR